jgi:hypothetical protein
MPFFGSEPFDTAEAIYVGAGAGQPGFFQVTVRGHARKISFGFQLRRDTDFVGGYTVTGRFNGSLLNEIVVIGANKTEVVRVREVPFTTEDEFMKHFNTA